MMASAFGFACDLTNASSPVRRPCMWQWSTGESRMFLEQELDADLVARGALALADRSDVIVYAIDETRTRNALTCWSRGLKSWSIVADAGLDAPVTTAGTAPALFAELVEVYRTGELIGPGEYGYSIMEEDGGDLIAYDEQPFVMALDRLAHETAGLGLFSFSPMPDRQWVLRQEPSEAPSPRATILSRFADRIFGQTRMEL